jgi:hypothetical protein
MNFANTAAFVAHLAGLAQGIEDMQHHLLEVACKAVEKEAKSEIGHYQDAAGPYPAWDELKASTIERKSGLEQPLIREGELRDSIHHSTDGHIGTVGSDDDAAVYQELGTHNMAPRSFLAGALYRLAPHLVTMVGYEYTKFLAGATVYNLAGGSFGEAAFAAEAAGHGTAGYFHPEHGYTKTPKGEGAWPVYFPAPHQPPFGGWRD